MLSVFWYKVFCYRSYIFHSFGLKRQEFYFIYILYNIISSLNPLKYASKYLCPQYSHWHSFLKLNTVPSNMCVSMFDQHTHIYFQRPLSFILIWRNVYSTREYQWHVSQSFFELRTLSYVSSPRYVCFYRTSSELE